MKFETLGVKMTRCHRQKTYSEAVGMDLILFLFEFSSPAEFNLEIEYKEVTCPSEKEWNT